MTDTPTIGTRAAYRALTHAEMCSEGCGRFILGSQKNPTRVIVANVYIDNHGNVTRQPNPNGDGDTSPMWNRTVVFHPDCYDGRYGEAIQTAG